MKYSFLKNVDANYDRNIICGYKDTIYECFEDLALSGQKLNDNDEVWCACPECGAVLTAEEECECCPKCGAVLTAED